MKGLHIKKLIRTAHKGFIKLEEFIPTPVFYWAANWEITRVCNLRCNYCFVRHQSEHPSMDRHIRTILQNQPKYIILAGGEPLIVPWLKQALTEIRRTYNPWIVINTNAVISEQRLCEILPLINGLTVSLDGIGKFNQVNRNMDSKQVLNNIHMAYNEMKQQDPDCELAVNAVVTKQSYEGLPELHAAIREIGPDIGICFNPVTPYDHPLSIAEDPSLYGEFIRIIKPLLETPFTDLSGPDREELRITCCRDGCNEPQNQQNGESRRTSTGHYLINCYRQFIWSQINAAGQQIFCNPHLFHAGFISDIKRFSREKHWIQTIKTISLMFRKILFGRNSCQCYHPCNCLQFLDDIFTHEQGLPVPHCIKYFRGRISETELRDLDAFLAANFGLPLSQAIKEALQQAYAAKSATWRHSPSQ